MHAKAKKKKRITSDNEMARGITLTKQSWKNKRRIDAPIRASLFMAD
jgi:hypothetical protein